MKQTMQNTLTWFIILSVATFLCLPAASADDASRAPSSTAPKLPPNLAKRIGEITDAVLTHHIDPPARQQMILGGIKALYRASGGQVPAGLSRRVSALATPEQIAGLLAEAWPKTLAKPVSAQALDEAMLHGLLESVPGGAYVMSAKERKVAEQMEGNRYVGIQIALAMDDREKLARMAEIFEGGPAERAGAMANDLIEKVDGTATKGMTLREVVNRLRGDEGTSVTVMVRQPNAKESRTLKMTRATLPRTTVRGVRKRTSGGWDVRIDGPDAVGYLRIDDISASTPHELRNLARQLENEGASAVVLDLRHLTGSLVHPTVLLADSLLEHGSIGRVRTVEREMTYDADSDALFRGWPMAVLVGEFTRGTAEWLAAALQDNHRAILVGSPTRGALDAPSAYVRSTVTVGDGSLAINLVTGLLERADGRSLSWAPLVPPSANSDEFRPRKGAAEHAKGGVKPDHATRENQNDKPGLPEMDFRRTGDEPVLSKDATLRKAVELLRRSAPKKA